MSWVIVKRSASGYRNTVRRLSEAIERRGLSLFCRIDHAAAARELDLELADEEVVVFAASVDSGADGVLLAELSGEGAG
jgi:uncharacterized protein (DUF302 family)